MQAPGPHTPNLVYELRSILERIDLAQLFKVPSNTLEIELGSGDGSFLAAYAAQHPDRNFIGVERLLGRNRKLEKKASRLGLNNVRAIRIESSYFLKYLLPPHSASALHIYFPDPWPKRRHSRHRLVNEGFPSLARECLAPAGKIFLRTDSPAYFAQMETTFRSSPCFRRTETPAELRAIVTDFEKEFNERGVATLRSAYELS